MPWTIYAFVLHMIQMLWNKNLSHSSGSSSANQTSSWLEVTGRDEVLKDGWSLVSSSLYVTSSLVLASQGLVLQIMPWTLYAFVLHMIQMLWNKNLSHLSGSSYANQTSSWLEVTGRDHWVCRHQGAALSHQQKILWITDTGFLHYLHCTDILSCL